MKKVFAIEYIECDYDGMSSMERSAFNSYRAASYFLMNLGYRFEQVKQYNYKTEEHEYNLRWTIDEGFTTWRAEIHELLLVE